MNLQRVQTGSNTFCGPAVLSSVCGISTDEAARVLTTITGRRVIKGIYTTELMKAFKALGYMTKVIDIKGSLFSVMSQVKESGIYIFMVPGHFIAIEIDNYGNRLICDNHTKKPINLGASARLGQRVDYILKIEKD